MFKISLLAAAMASLVPATALGNNKQPAPDLFDDFGIQQSTKKALPTKVVKGRNRSVNVRTDLLESDTLTLNLFDDVIVTAVRDRLVDNGKTYTWIGSVVGEPDSEVFLTIRGKTMSGNVQIGDKTYEIEPKGSSLHDISQVDPAKNPPHSQLKEPEEFLPDDADEPTMSASTTGTIIDLLVAYTPKAKNNASGQAGIEAKIANAVAMANQAYINSKIDMQLNLVGMVETNYVETGDMSTSLADLKGTSDGKMDEVHTLRNKVGADQVALISADANYCGIAYTMKGSWVSTAFAPYAFSVVHDDSRGACLSNHSFAHELGHNQGDQHNLEDSPNLGAYSYSYGYRLCQTGGFRTVMSYACSGAARVSYFSNPNVTLTTGQVTGTSAANNALSMTNTKGIVASFRSSTTTPTMPNAPGNLAAAALSSSQIAITWSDNSTDETGFRIERSADGSNWYEIAVVGSNSVSFTDNGLAASASYYYRARAYNSSGYSSYSNVGAATTITTATPTPADTTAPTVSIMNPANGTKISGDVVITAQASDNVGVNRLQIFIDDKLVSSINKGSLKYNWKTSYVKAGVHTIRSVATDLSNNIGSTSISVTK